MDMFLSNRKEIDMARQSSFSRYCEYRGNRASYELLTSIPAFIIFVVLAGWIIKWLLILFACYFVVSVVYYSVKNYFLMKKKNI